jgi:predicted alpha-1,2-mannosidase
MLSLRLPLLFTLGLASALGASPVDYVDPFLGVRGKGNVVIGPVLPHGSIHPSPNTPDGGHDGYHPDRPIRGFAQLHASGTGWGRYGNLLLSPQSGGLALDPLGHDSTKADERATPWSYAVTLSRYATRVEVSPTHHAASYRFTFPADDQAHLMLDLAHQIPGQIHPRIPVKDLGVTRSQLTLSPDGRSVSGSSRYDGGWGAGPYTVFFHAEIDRAPAESGTWKNASASAARSETWTAPGDRVGAWWRFSTRADEPVHLKIAVSFHSVERARVHLAREIPGWDHDAVAAAARAAWEKNLGLVAVEGGTPARRTQLYTALYHAQIMPRDRTGEFARYAPDAPMWDDHYAVWDTWRTKFPLMVMLQPDMVRGVIASFSERLRVDGRIRDSVTAGTGPAWSIADQGGNNVDNIIADAHAKGLRGVDWAAAWRVLEFNANHERRGNRGAVDRPDYDNPAYRENGWLPMGVMAVSNTLEYAYNDFLASRVARALGHTAEADRLLARSRQWQQLFNPDKESDGFAGFIMPRTADGAWVDWNPRLLGGSWKEPYYEGTAWNYSFFAPHQVARLVTLMGGPETFVRRLEFGLDEANKDDKGHPLIDVSNEPAFLAPQWFHHAGRPDLAARHLRRALARFTPAGYPGDDDSGAMSSYFVWGCLGLFPNAGQDLYYLNGPLFDRIVINRPDEGRLEITRRGEGDYVAAVTLNGKALDRSWIRHTELSPGSVLAFTMSPEPTDWARRGELPPSDDAAP